MAIRARANGNEPQCPVCRAVIDHITELEPPVPPTVHDLKGSFTTFKDVCMDEGLLADDGEWSAAMREASQTAMPAQLRALFMHIICFCQPLQPHELFETFCMPMGDDFRRELQSRQLDTDANVRTCVLFVLLDGLDPATQDVDRTAVSLLPELSDADKAFVAGLGAVQSSPLDHVYNYDEDIQLAGYA